MVAELVVLLKYPAEIMVDYDNEYMENEPAEAWTWNDDHAYSVYNPQQRDSQPVAQVTSKIPPASDGGTS